MTLPLDQIWDRKTWAIRSKAVEEFSLHHYTEPYLTFQVFRACVKTPLFRRIYDYCVKSYENEEFDPCDPYME